MADEATERITILLQAKDKDLARAMDRNNKLIAKFARDADRSTTQAARNVDGNLRALAGSAGAFGKSFVMGIGAGLITAALGAVTTNIRATIADIADMVDAADRIGFSAEQFQALQFGMQQAGVSQAEFSKGMEKLSENIGDAARGSGTFGKIAEANGIAIKDAGGNIRATTDILADFADLIRRTPDEAARMSLVTEAFGRGGKAMVLAMATGKAGLEEMQAAAIEAGVVIDEQAVRKAAELDDKFEVLTARIGTLFKTWAVEAAAAGVALGEALASLNDDAPQAYQAEDYDMDALTVQAQRLNEAIGMTALVLDEVGSSVAAEVLRGIAAEVEQLSIDLTNGTKSAEEYQQGLQDSVDKADSFLISMGEINGIDMSGARAEIASIGGVIDGIIGKAVAAVNALHRLSVTSRPDGGGSNAPIGVPSMNFPDYSGNNGLTRSPFGSIPSGLGTAPIVVESGGGGGGGRGDGGGGSSAVNEQLREAERLYEETRTAAEKYAAELADIQDLQKGGLIDADTYARAVEMIGEKYLETTDAMKVFEDGGKQAFVSIVTGAESAHDAVAGLFDKMAELLASDAWDALVGGLRGKGAPAGGNLIGGILSGLGGLFGGARANGGPVQAGKAYLVGERGPEPFIPSSNGTILPASSLTGGKASPGAMSVTIGFDQSSGSFTAMVRDEAGRVVAQAAPGIVRQSMAAVQQANQATGAFLG